MSIAHGGAAGLVLALAVACAPAGPPSQADEVRDVVEAIYAPYLRQDPDAGGLAAVPWTDELAAKLTEIEERFARTLNAWGLEYDPIVNSQESYVANVRVGAPVLAEDGTATVVVRYNNGGREDEIQEFVLIQQHGEWRVSDLRLEEWSFAAQVDEAVTQGRAYDVCMQSRPAAEC